MPLDNIFTSCRKGDLSRIHYLVEEKEVDLNVRDCWDSTPLYYACLCGHIEVVKYLLKNGARCEANTFDGERCFYGALTNEIKKVLVDAKVITSQSKRRDEYDEFLERLMRCNEFSDVTFRLQDVSFNLHRCILSARSEYLRQVLQIRTKEVRTNVICSSIFEVFVRYVYTSRTAFSKELSDQFIRLADKCKMNTLKESVQQAIADVEFFELTKQGRINNVNTIILESSSSLNELQQDLNFLIEAGIPSEFSQWPPSALPFMPTIPEAFFDVCLYVDGYAFYCHKLFLCTRSGYLDALSKNHFEESPLDENNIQRITLKDVSAPVIACILYFIYTNNPMVLTEDNVYDVLEAADIYLLPGLTRLCGNFLCNYINSQNIISILRLARLHQLTRLEDSCASYIARNIGQCVKMQEFQEFVIMDANEVVVRQDTDSIQIIDDVRYQISSKVLTFSEVLEANENLRVIDQMLEELGLDA